MIFAIECGLLWQRLNTNGSFNRYSIAAAQTCLLSHANLFSILVALVGFHPLSSPGSEWVTDVCRWCSSPDHKVVFRYLARLASQGASSFFSSVSTFRFSLMKTEHFYTLTSCRWAFTLQACVCQNCLLDCNLKSQRIFAVEPEFCYIYHLYDKVQIGLKILRVSGSKSQKSAGFYLPTIAD